jgi:hypothetical protein
MKKTRVYLMSIAALLLCCGTFVMWQSGCAGGGGSAPTVAEAEEAMEAQISGKISIQGVTDYTGVVVVAEKTVEGTTASVRAMMKQAEKNERISARQAMAADGVYTTTTGADGAFALFVPEGDYTVSAFKQDAVAAQPQKVSARAAAAVTVNFELIATGKVAGAVSLPTSVKASNCMVIAYLDGTSFAAYADPNGAYTISNVPIGTYNIVFVIGQTKMATHTGIAVTAGATTSSATANYTMACNIASECDDSNANTNEYCENPYSEQAVCRNLSPTTVLSYSPANGATNVSRQNFNVKVVFSNPMTIQSALCVYQISRNGIVITGYPTWPSYVNGSSTGPNPQDGIWTLETTNVSNDTIVYTPSTYHSQQFLTPNTTFSASFSGCSGSNQFNYFRDVANYQPILTNLPSTSTFTTGP